MTRGIHGAICKEIDVEYGDVADNAIGNSNLRDSCVSTAEIADGAVTNTKLVAALRSPVIGVALGYKIARGLFSCTTAGAATIPTGLSSIVGFALTAKGTSSGTIANDCVTVNGVISSTNIIARRWKHTGASTVTLVAATATGGLYWCAVGT